MNGQQAGFDSQKVRAQEVARLDALVGKLLAENRALRAALEEIILLPGEDGPRHGSHADHMARIAEDALATPDPEVER
jgi:hypothetical protein